MITIMTDTEGQTFYLQFPYHPQTIAIVKTIDGRRWNPDLKLWYLPATPAYADIIDRTLSHQHYTADEPFNAMLVKHREGLTVQKREPVVQKTCTPCFRHQLVGLDLIVNRSVVYLAWDCGTGKSKTIVDATGVLQLQRTLVLCPKSVVQEWPRQYVRHGSTYGIRCVALDKGSVSKRTEIADQALRLGPATVVINYEAAWAEPFGDWALGQNWDMVVCDEAHRLQESRTRISKFVHKLAEHTTRRVALSGTPIPNNPLGLWSQCRFLDIGIFGSSFLSFRARYACMGGFQNRQVLSFRNLDDMHRRFYEIAHRVTKQECLDLPAEMDETREAELGPEGVKHYRAMEGQFYAAVENGTITLANVLVESLRLQQCTGGAVQYDGHDHITEIDTAKSDLLADIMADLPATEPIVVFCRFHHDLDTVHAIAKKCKRTCYELSGRRRELEKWRSEDPNATVLAVQIRAGGLGIDLTRACYAVFYSLGFSLEEYLQARSRLHRQGQTRSVTYYNLLALCKGRKTIDHRVYRALAKKGKVADEILVRDTESA